MGPSGLSSGCLVSSPRKTFVNSRKGTFGYPPRFDFPLAFLRAALGFWRDFLPLAPGFSTAMRLARASSKERGRRESAFLEVIDISKGRDPKDLRPCRGACRPMAAVS